MEALPWFIITAILVAVITGLISIIIAKYAD